MAAPSFIAGNIGADTSQAGFTMGSPTGGGTPSQGDWWWGVLNVRNNEQPTAALSGWNYVGASPVASDTSGTGLSQIFVYWIIQGASAPSLAVTRGSGPNLCNWGLHVYRPASGYVWDTNFAYSFQTEASATTAHSHPSVTAYAIDAIISHFVGFAGNGGGSLFDSATDPATDSGASSTPNTTDFVSGSWQRRGNQGSGSLMTGGLSLGTGLKVSAGATGANTETMTLSRRHASFVAALSQVKTATLSDAATSGETFTGYRIKSATLSDASLSAETLAAMRLRTAAMTKLSQSAESLTGAAVAGGSYKNGALTDAATSGETMTGSRVRTTAVTDAATSGETLPANRIRSGALTKAAQSAETMPGSRLRTATVNDAATSGETMARRAIRQGALTDPAISAETFTRRAIKTAALTDAAISGQSFSVRGWSVVAPTGETWTPVLPTAEIWTVIPSPAEVWS
jgi:hypothetical protein